MGDWKYTKEIIVTGASGFVGINLTKYICNEAIGTVSRLDLRQGVPDAIPVATNAIIHLAGKAHDSLDPADPDVYFKVNTELTIRLFDKYIRSKADDFIYFSSVKAVADDVDDILVENTVPNPKTPYGKSKLKAEEYILSQELPPGKRVIIFRPCMIHGPGNKGNLNLLFNIVRKGIPYPLAAFDNKRSFLSMFNLLFVIGHILRGTYMPSGIYNLADDVPLSTAEVVRIMGEACNVKTRLLKVSPRFVKIVARSGDILHLPMDSRRLKKLTESYVVSNEKILAALGIESFPISSRDGLFETVRSLRNDFSPLHWTGVL